MRRDGAVIGSLNAAPRIPVSQLSFPDRTCGRRSRAAAWGHRTVASKCMSLAAASAIGIITKGCLVGDELRLPPGRNDEHRGRTKRPSRPPRPLGRSGTSRFSQEYRPRVDYQAQRNTPDHPNTRIGTSRHLDPNWQERIEFQYRPELSFRR